MRVILTSDAGERLVGNVSLRVSTRALVRVGREAFLLTQKGRLWYRTLCLHADRELGVRRALGCRDGAELNTRQTTYTMAGEHTLLPFVPVYCPRCGDELTAHREGCPVRVTQRGKREVLAC